MWRRPLKIETRICTKYNTEVRTHTCTHVCIHACTYRAYMHIVEKSKMTSPTSLSTQTTTSPLRLRLAGLSNLLAATTRQRCSRRVGATWGRIRKSFAASGFQCFGHGQWHNRSDLLLLVDVIVVAALLSSINAFACARATIQLWKQTLWTLTLTVRLRVKLKF